MKSKIVIISTALTVVLSILLSVISTPVSAMNDVVIVDGGNVEIDNKIDISNEIDISMEQNVYNIYSFPVIVQELEKQEKKDGYFTKVKKSFKSADTYKSLFKDIVPVLGQIVKNTDDVDWNKVAIEASICIVNTIAACFKVDGITKAIFKEFSGLAPKPQSEIEALKQEIKKQFDEVKEELDNIRNDIKDLSSKVDESTSLVLKSIEEAGETYKSEAEVVAFLSNRDGVFDYNQFKTFLSGVDGHGRYYDQAYADLLDKALESEDVTSEEIKKCYDDLYCALMSPSKNGFSNFGIFWNYIIASEEQDSVQRSYYTMLFYGKDDVLQDGESVAHKALMFSHDVYTHANEAIGRIYACQLYQYTQMALSGVPIEEASYVTTDGTVITYNDWVRTNNYLGVCADELELQFAKDLAYIFQLEKGCIVGDDNGLRVQHMFGDNIKVSKGQTVYMFKLTDIWCDRFAIDNGKFTYTWFVNGVKKEQNDGRLFIDIETGVVKCDVAYNGESVYSIQFNVGDLGGFSGGSGTLEDPYLIGTPEQLYLMHTTYDAMNKHYKLIDDILLYGSQYEPIGTKDKPFNGTFDGNGYTIFGITANSEECTGLFNYIGEDGMVKNLTISQSTFSVVSDKEIEMLVGGFAAYNQGTIYNCHLNNSKITAIHNSDIVNENVILYVAGIAAKSVGGKICCCSVSSTELITESKRNYGGNSDSKNKNSVYVSGIVANASQGTYMENVLVEKSVTIDAYAFSKCHRQETAKPHVKIWASGIVAYGNSFGVKNAYSEITIEKCLVERKNADITYGSTTKNIKRYCDNAYIPGWEIEDIEKISVDSVSEVEFPKSNVGLEIKAQFDGPYDTGNNVNIGAYNEKYGCYEGQLYAYGETELNTDGLVLFANEKYVNYKVLSYYNFDTTVSDKETPTFVDVILVLLVYLENEAVICTVEFPILVMEAEPIEIEVIREKEQYELDEEITDKFYLIYQDGERVDITSEIKGNLPNGITGNAGMQSITVSYGEILCQYVVNVYCAHTNIKYTTVPTTCTHYGYVLLSCECGYTQKNNEASELLGHEIELVDYVEATCQQNGYSGDSVCTVCERKIKRGVSEPRLPHNFSNSDNGMHYCIDCNQSEKHIYNVVEQVDKMIYTCTVEECKKTEVVEIRVSEDVPRVVVSEAYAIKGSDDIVEVHIKLFGNPGISGVNLRVEHDKKLQFVKAQRGELLKNSLAAVVSNNGIIGIASADILVGDGKSDGCLIKLYFKVPKEAALGEEYDVSIAYGTDQFADANANTIHIVTMSGKITVVERLPGDVNGDGKVDILDASLIVRYSALNKANMDTASFVEKTSFDKIYADVDLDGSVLSNDAAVILQFMAGVNSQELLNHEYKITLNYNDESASLDSILVKFYDEQGNRGRFDGLKDLQGRKGYRFVGWFKSLDVYNEDGTLNEDLRITAGSFVEYNETQKKQTLYAIWSKNELVLDGNGAILDENQDKLIFTYPDHKVVELVFTCPDNEAVVPDKKGFEKTSIVTFVYGDNNRETIPHPHELDFWGLSANAESGESYPEPAVNLEDGEIGELTLYAIWDVWMVELPVLTMDGYIFNGWRIEGDTTNKLYAGGEKIVVDGAKTVVADWTRVKYTVIYKAGDGFTEEDQIEQKSVVSGSPLAKNPFERRGYTFVGWTDGDKLYSAEEFVHLTKKQGATVELTAKWKANKGTIVYNSNGGIGSMETTECYFDQAFSLRTNAFSKEGYDFLGWHELAGAETPQYDANEEINSNLHIEDGQVITLYAVWKAKEFKIVYNLNTQNFHGDILEYNVSKSEGTATYGKNYSLDVPWCEGEYYQFTGWYLQADGSVQLTYDNGASISSWSNVTDGNIVVYAMWKNVSGYEYIATAEELQSVSVASKTKYKLLDDIDISGIEWSPIGTTDVPFAGELDGNGKVINGLTITNPKVPHIGLFGCIASATIRDVRVVNVNIVNTTVTNASIGGVVGEARMSVIEKCYSSGSIVSGKAYTINDITALVGAIAGNMSEDTSYTGCTTDIVINNTALICDIDHKITDSGRWSQMLLHSSGYPRGEYVDLNEIYGVCKNDLINLGISTIKIITSIESKDIDNGNHHLFVYNANVTSGNDALAWSGAFTDPNDGSVSKHSFTFEINVEDICDEESLIILYVGSGEQNDDWKVLNLWVGLSY